MGQNIQLNDVACLGEILENLSLDAELRGELVAQIWHWLDSDPVNNTQAGEKLISQLNNNSCSGVDLAVNDVYDKVKMSTCGILPMEVFRRQRLLMKRYHSTRTSL